MGRILIVDDEPNIRDTVSLALRRKGYETLCAATPSDALALVEQQLPDLIISDVCMQDGDGFSLLEAIRSNPRTGAIPVLIITGNPDHDGMVRGFENGADGYLPKPVSLHTLLAAVQSRLRREELVRRDASEVKTQLYRVLEASPDLIAIIDPETLSVLFLNHAGTKLLETTDKAQSRITSYFSAEGSENFLSRAIPEALESGQWLGETELVTPSGKRLTVELVLQAHHRYDGKVEYFSLIARDLTERHANERALRASEYRFRCLVNALPDGVLISNAQGEITFANAYAARLLNYSPQEFLQVPLATVFGGAAPENSGGETASPKGANLPSEYVVYAKNGEALPVSIFREELNVEGEQVNLFILHNLSERKRIERERQSIEMQLRQAQKLESIGQLAAGIAHEINTPTQYIGDNTRFLKDAFSCLGNLLQLYRDCIRGAGNSPISPEKMKELEEKEEALDLSFLLTEIPGAFEQCLEGIARVSKIVGAMKDFSHPNSTEKTLLDINNAIESTITVARNEWKYVADLETDLDAALPRVPCLPGEFNQVILNLIVNAAHAIGDVIPKSSQEKGAIRVSTRRKGTLAEVRISDTGTGIPEKVQPRIFEPFFTTKEVGKGTGQGLAIARSVVVDKHGGTIEFETEQGKGTTFIIQLPLQA